MKYLFCLMVLFNICSCRANDIALPSHDFHVVDAVAAPDGGTMHLTISSRGEVYDIGVYQPLEQDYFQCYISQAGQLLYKVSQEDRSNVILNLLKEWLHFNDMTNNQIVNISRGGIPVDLKHEQRLVAELFYECSNLGLLN